MIDDEYIYKNATQIAEERIRAARRLQANEAARRWKETFAAIKDLRIRWTRALLGGNSLAS